LSGVLAKCKTLHDIFFTCRVFRLLDFKIHLMASQYGILTSPGHLNKSWYISRGPCTPNSLPIVIYDTLETASDYLTANEGVEIPVT
jgi:hypothetical protein